MDGVFRLWASVIDDPDFFGLWATLHHTPFMGQGAAPQSIVSRWVERGTLNMDMAGPDTDHVVTAFADGSIGITELNVRINS